MSDLTLAEKDPDVVLAEALAQYTALTGVTLAPADPRRLFIQTFVLLLAQQRQLIDFSGKQSLPEYVSDTWIDELAELWGLTRLAAAPSTCTLRFTFSVAGAYTVLAGVRATNGTNLWAVDVATTSGPAVTFVDATASCTVTGSATNDVLAGQISTLVDAVPGCSGVVNLGDTISGRDLESLADFRTRLRSAPESTSAAGPRLAYEAAALEASASVADAEVLGPEDGADMDGAPPSPGEVYVYIIQGTRDSAGVLTSVVPDPDLGLLTTVDDALSADDVRPLTDYVSVFAPTFVDFDITVTYYISRERQAEVGEIQTAVDAAFEAYKLWQIRIGRDINPSNLIGRLMVAGAKRVTVTLPAFTTILRDQCPRLVYDTLTYGGVEDE